MACQINQLCLQPSLESQCFQHGASAPSSRAVTAGLVEKAEDADFARRLPGAGPEALLGMAEGAIRAGR